MRLRTVRTQRGIDFVKCERNLIRKRKRFTIVKSEEIVKKKGKRSVKKDGEDWHVRQEFLRK